MKEKIDHYCRLKHYILSSSSPAWRDSFLVERGKMTPIRFEKINDRLRTPSSSANTSATTTNSNEVPIPAPPSEAVENAAAQIFEHPTLTNKARLAVECLKPRYSAPCGPYQKHKCVRRADGDWKMKSCKAKASNYFRPDSELMTCHCAPGAEFGWRPQLATFASDVAVFEDEKRRQREFIKRYTGLKVNLNNFINLRYYILNYSTGSKAEETAPLHQELEQQPRLCLVSGCRCLEEASQQQSPSKVQE